MKVSGLSTLLPLLFHVLGTQAFSLFPMVVAPLKRAVSAVKKVNGYYPKKPTTGTNRNPTSAAEYIAMVENAPSLLDQMIPYTSMPLEHSITLPPEAYTSEDFFQVEKETIFQPGWICVAHVAQIPNKGDYFTLDLLGERMVIVNAGQNSKEDESSEGTSSKSTTTTNIQVLSRVCSHRWASICEEGQGTSVNKFTCPMHRWSFDLEGNLLGTPYMDDVVNFDKSNHGLQKYKSETIGGFVYVNIDGTADSLDPQITELTAWMENWETEKAQIFNIDQELNYDCDFNWVSRLM
jgi:nitrite reductase/ring-hydroxylating ferredoxin subunit